jgi:hypothetical protein
LPGTYWNELSLCQSWLASAPAMRLSPDGAIEPSRATFEMSISVWYLSRPGALLSLVSPVSSEPNALDHWICSSWLIGWPRNTSTA